MGPPPWSLAAEANDCFMVRVSEDPTEYKVAARKAPGRRLPSDHLLWTDNNAPTPALTAMLPYKAV
jgi:hypothetical protein